MHRKQTTEIHIFQADIAESEGLKVCGDAFSDIVYDLDPFFRIAIKFFGADFPAAVFNC